MTNTNYNIAIIGQTGVGKSSLINYLFGSEVTKSGIGRPVTTNGFHEINHKIKDMTVKIYDSWGLEVGKEEQWLKELNTELKNRGIDKPASDWFHSIFYCIAASGGRIQDADSKIVKKLINENYKVSIILTKADSLTEEEEAEFIKVIAHELGNNMAIIPVCSEHKKTRGGEIFPFGKERVEKQSLIDLVDSLVLRIPQHCKEAMLTELRTWEAKQHKKIDDDLGFFGFSASELRNELSSSSEIIGKKINEIGNLSEKEALEQYTFIAKNIGMQISTKYASKDPKIDGYQDSKLEWFLIPFVPIAFITLPFYAPLLRKGEAKEMHNELDNFCEKTRKIVDEKISDLKNSLEMVKEKIQYEII